MIYGERIDLGRRRKCIVVIRVIDGKVFAEMSFYNNEKFTHNVIIYKDTDADVVKVSHNGKRFPEYVKRVLNVLSRLVLPSIYYKECVFDETR